MAWTAIGEAALCVCLLALAGVLSVLSASVVAVLAVVVGRSRERPADSWWPWS